MIPLNTQHLRAYQVENDVLVLHQPSGSLHAVEGLGCWLFLGLDQGLTVQQLQAEYQQNYPANPISQNQWIQMLVAIEPLFDANSEETTYREEYAAILQQQPAIPSQSEDTVYFQLNDLTFAVLSDQPALLTALRQIKPEEKSLQHNLIHCQFEIKQNATTAPINYQIFCNEQLLAKAIPFQGLMPLLMDYFQILAYQSQKYLLAIHAAAVVKNGVALLLPGTSGSGKSTLCVSLVEQGFECYSDELAVLSYPTGHVQPLPLPMAVKTGSWKLLESTWPALQQATIWQRPDGRRLKYIPLPESSRPKTPNIIQQQYVIFPHYDANTTQVSLQPLSPIDLLRRLAAAGYQIKTTLDAAKVEHLIYFASHTPAYALHYANLAQAHHHLGTLYDSVNHG